MEIWKEVAGYDGKYKVSNLGNVMSMNYRLTNKPKLLHPTVNAVGYCELTLTKDGKRTRHQVHRLVAEAFIPNAENKKCVNHIDFDKTNNSADNLEWCSYLENTAHSLQRITEATRAANNKAVVQCDLAGNVIAVYDSISEASRRTNINCGHICQCAKGKEKTSGGYRWAYVKKRKEVLNEVGSAI